MNTKKIISAVLLVSVLSCGPIKRADAEVNWKHVGLGVVAGAAVSAIGSLWLAKKVVNKYFQMQMDRLQQQNSLFKENHEKTFDDFVGQDMVEPQVDELFDSILTFSQYEDLGAKRPKGLLIEGDAGSGKTLLVDAMAAKYECALLRISCLAFVDRSPEEIEGAFVQLMETARKKSREKLTIFFVDDLDEIFNPEAAPFVKKMMRRIETYLAEVRDGEMFLLIGAMKDASCLDMERVARAGISRLKLFPLSPQGRQAVTEYYLQKIKLDPELSVEALAKKWIHKFRGLGEIYPRIIKEFVEAAAMVALNEKSEHVTSAHFDAAFDLKIGGLKTHRALTQEELHCLAVHEAGHALLTVLTGNRSLEATIVSRESYNGLVLPLNSKHESEGFMNKEDWMRKMVAYFGGYCAEKLVFGQTRPGAVADLQEINGNACMMVDCFGMGDGLAGVTIAGKASDAVKEEFDRAAIKIIQKCRDEAERLLADHRDKLDILTNALLEHKTLLEEEIYALVGQPMDMTEGIL